MNQRRILVSALILAGGLILGGCDSNPTNAPSPDAIQKAKEDQIKAIDADKTMTDADKAKLKEMKHLNTPTPGAASSADPGAGRK